MSRTRVMFVLPNLGGGGAERAMLNICTHLDRDQFEPLLVLGAKEGPYCSQIPSDILTISMDAVHMRKCIGKLASAIGVIKPDIVFSTLTHMNLVTIAAHSISRSTSRIVVREASVHSEASTELPRLRRTLLDTMIRTHYRKAHSVVFLTEGASREFVKMFPSVDIERCRVIHNPIDLALINTLKSESVDAKWWPSNKRTITAVGRLTAAKGYRYLLDAMKIVLLTLPDTFLLVMGSGEEEEDLQAHSRRLGIDQSVMFIGFQENPFKYIARSDLFVLPSLWEGFANVVVEAMACGVPVIATRCPYGPREIIGHGHNGILVQPGDSEALASSIITVMKDPGLRLDLVHNGLRRAEDFDVATIVREYGMLFRELVE